MATGEHPTQKTQKLRWSTWNLLLLVPFVTLLTPLCNGQDPKLFGFPYFYWFQFAIVPVAVICVWVVYLKTRDVSPPTTAPDRPVEELDEGAAR